MIEKKAFESNFEEKIPLFNRTPGEIAEEVLIKEVKRSLLDTSRA